MKIVCIETCFFSKGLKKFDDGQTYEVSPEDLKALNSAGQLKRFTTESGAQVKISQLPADKEGK
jgi:hypothetical protein